MVVLKMFAVLAFMVILMRKRISLGNSMVGGALLLWLLMSPTVGTAWTAVSSTLERGSTWEVMLAMYFVMSLEYLLRTQGILDGFMSSIRQLLRSDRILLAFMPAFLGFLPSMGGALFSAPMVENAAKTYALSPEDKTAINYWFRHIWEFSNPIVPALLLASEIASVPVSVLITHLAGYTVLAAALGWLVLLTGQKYRLPSLATAEHGSGGQRTLNAYAHRTGLRVAKGAGTEPTDRRNINITVDAVRETAVEKTDTTDRELAAREMSANIQNVKKYGALTYVLLAAGPIFANIFLVVLFDLSAALSMGIVVTGMVVWLKLKPTGIGKMLEHAFDRKLMWGIFSILLFQETLEATGMITDIVILLKSSGVPAHLMVGILALLIGMLTGQLQGFVAVAFPMITALSPGNLSLIVTGYVMGVVGAMLSPAHLCLVVTLEYFKANFVRSLRPIFLMTGVVTIVLTVTNLVT